MEISGSCTGSDLNLTSNKNTNLMWGIEIDDFDSVQ